MDLLDLNVGEMISFDSYMNQLLTDKDNKHSKDQKTVVQPRMGFSKLSRMKAGLEAVEKFKKPRIATLTLDSKTRQKKFEDSYRAILCGEELNGYPIAAHGAQTTADLIKNIQKTCPVQMRHGSPDPIEVFKIALDAGIDATEGGPISYCLPYGRVGIKDSIIAWRKASKLWADGANRLGRPTHIESFGGCMMGQLCPPSLLVAISVLEGIFFQSAGIRSMSLSAVQGSNDSQDIGAIIALRRLAERFLNKDTSWHIVVYAFMGLFPKTYEGASRIITKSGYISAIGGANRVIVKTTSESRQIPSIKENLYAMELTTKGIKSAKDTKPSELALKYAKEIENEAEKLIQVALSLSKNIDTALNRAFEKGYLDVPYCIHPDNHNQVSSFVDPVTGVIKWINTGKLPIDNNHGSSQKNISSNALLESLKFNQVHYDRSNV